MADLEAILKAAELLARGDVSGMSMLPSLPALPPSLGGAAGGPPVPKASPGVNAAAMGGGNSKEALIGRALAFGIGPERLKLAQSVGAVRLRLIQEQVQQKYLEAYTQQLVEAQSQANRLHEQQQEAMQLALIMEAANTQADMAKQSLEEDQAEHHWHRRLGRKGEVCSHWKRGFCQRSDKCQFGHPERERGLLQPRGPANIIRHNFKSSLCRNFMFQSGTCPQGTRCMFAHGPKELRSPGMSLNREEEEIVQRVAAAKMSKPPGSGAGPAAVLPPGLSSLAGGLPPGLLAALGAHTDPAATAALAAQQAEVAAQQAELKLQTGTAELMAKAGLLNLNIDPSQLALLGLLPPDAKKPRLS